MHWLQATIILIAVFLKVYKSEHIIDLKSLDSAVFLLIVSVVLPTLPTLLSPFGLNYLNGNSGGIGKLFLFIGQFISVINGIIIAIAVHKLWKSIGAPQKIV